MIDPSNAPPVVVTGESEFEKIIVDATMSATHMVAAADFDADGDIDLVSTAELDDTVAWFENDGALGFTKRVIDNQLGQAYPASVADIDRDGDIDILAGGYGDDEFVIYTNDGAGSFTTLVSLPSNGAHSIFAIDLDGDGDEDLVTSSQDANRAAWYENDGALNFTERPIDTNLARAKTAIPADVDGDGDLDVVGTSNSGDDVYWYENDGTQNFTRLAIDTAVDGAYYAIAADVDGDGDEDVLSVGQNDNSVNWHVNDGSENFSKIVVDSTVFGARAVAAADVDLDGDLDIFATARDGNTLNWYRNDGGGIFTSLFVDQNIDGVYGVEIFDVNKDGLPDVLSAARDSGEIAVHIHKKAHTANVSVGDTIVIGPDLLKAVDPDNGPTELTYTMTTVPTTGELQLEGEVLAVGATFSQDDIDTERFSYTHDASGAAADGFSFTLADGGEGGLAPAQGSFTFNIFAPGPIATDDVLNTTPGMALVIDIAGELLANDVDPDGDPFFFDSFTQPANGSVSETSPGELTYTPDSSFTGVDAFSYTITDGALTDVGAVTVNVSPFPVPLYNEAGAMVFDGTAVSVVQIPHAAVFEIPEGTIAFSFTAADTIGVQGLFSKDASGFGGGGNHFVAFLNGSTLTTRFQDGADDWTSTIPGIVAGQEYEVAFTFGPDGTEVWLDGNLVESNPLVMDWTQNVEYIQWGGRGWASQSGQPGFDAPFEGTIADKQIYSTALTASQIAALAATSSASNNPPEAIDDDLVLDEDGSATFDPTVNDSDPEDDPISATGIATDPANGEAIVNGDGTVTYAPDADFNGTDSFQVIISDATGSSTSTVNVTVNPVNDDPDAIDDDVSTVVDTPAIFDVTDNDIDVDGDTLVITAVTDGASGTVADNGDGMVTYTPNAGFVGDDSFTYTISDGNGGAEDTATVTVQVLAAPNTAPTAVDDPYNTAEDTVLSIAGPGVLSNDTDNEGDSLTAFLVNGPSNGALTFNTDGSFDYTPNADFNGQDSFTYLANDGNADSPAPATVTITVDPVNDAPVAADDGYTVSQDGTLTVGAAAGVLNNDTDVDNGSLTAVLDSGPANGGLTLNADGSFTYTPNAGFDRTDTFTYFANDGTVDSAAPATVSINVSSFPTPVFEQAGVKTYSGSSGDVDNYPPSSDLQIPEGTIAFSFIDDNPSSRQGLVVKDASFFAGGGNHFAAYIEKGELKVRFQDGSNSTTFTVDDIVAGQEYEVAAVFSGSGVELWVNGELGGRSDPSVMDWTTNVEYMQIGGLGWGSSTGTDSFTNPFSGQIADVEIYDTALDSDQIQQLADESSILT